MKSLPIDTLRKRFKKQWLLISIDKMDEKRGVPLSGHVIAHSPHRDEVNRAMLEHKGLDVVIFSEKTLQKSYAAAF